MKEFKKDKCGCVCNSLIGLFLFVIFLIFVGNKEMRDWTNSNGGLAAWVQAFGAIAAIGVVLIQAWFDKRSRAREQAERVRGILDRSVFALKDLQRFCKKSSVLVSYFSFGQSPLPVEAQLHQTLNASSLQLEKLPYWDLSETVLAVELQNVLHAVSLMHIAIDYEKGEAYRLLQNLQNACEQAESVVRKQLEVYQNQ